MVKITYIHCSLGWDDLMDQVTGYTSFSGSGQDDLGNYLEDLDVIASFSDVTNIIRIGSGSALG